MNYKLSAVVPVHGLSRNLSSVKRIIEATPPNIQLIIVHDNTDEEDIALLSFINRSQNIILLSVNAGSPGAARNIGKNLATGSWLTFWDADDLPYPNNVLESISDADTQLHKMIVGRFRKQNGNIYRSSKIFNLSKPHSNIDTLKYELGLWRCIFKTSFAKLIDFEDLRIGEDQLYLMDLLPEDLTHFHFSNLIIYDYLDSSSGSITNSNLQKSLFNNLKSTLSKRQNLNALQKTFKITARLRITVSELIRFPTKSLILQFLLLAVRHPRSTIQFVLSKIFRERNNVPQVLIPLMGGLGNQLFQVSAGLFYTDGEVRVLSGIANPVLNSEGRPEIDDIILPNRISIEDFQIQNMFTQKLINLSIRVSTKERTIVHRLLEISIAILFSMTSRELIRVKVSSGLGYTDFKHFSKGKTLLVGYFQSHIYASSLRRELDLTESFVKKPSQYFDSANHYFSIEKWRLIHVRLGDYLQNEDFGILSPNYLLTQINLQENRLHLTSKVFSNDHDKLRQLSSKLHGYVYVEKDAMSSTEILALCSTAKQFVISNSTFSWWAAYISGKTGPDVIYPSPWFKNLVTPEKLNPTTWAASAASYL
jgi:glycosyltransferase involved in cell wall biosynthesis